MLEFFLFVPLLAVPVPVVPGTEVSVLFAGGVMDTICFCVFKLHFRGKTEKFPRS